MFSVAQKKTRGQQIHLHSFFHYFDKADPLGEEGEHLPLLVSGVRVSIEAFVESSTRLGDLEELGLLSLLYFGFVMDYFYFIFVDCLLAMSE